MDTDNSVVMVKGETKEERMRGICNSVNNKSENKQKPPLKTKTNTEAKQNRRNLGWSDNINRSVLGKHVLTEPAF